MKKYLLSIIFMLSASTTQIMANPWRTAELDGLSDAIEARINARMAAIKSDTKNEQGINYFQLDCLEKPLKYIGYYKDNNVINPETVNDLEKEKWAINISIECAEKNINSRFSEQAQQQITSTCKEISQLLDITITNYNKAKENTNILPYAQAAFFVELALKIEALYDAYEGFKPLTPIQLERMLVIKNYRSKHPLDADFPCECLIKIRDYSKEMNLGAEEKNRLEEICNTSLGLSMTPKDRAYSVWAVFAEFELANIEEILWR